MRLLVPVFQMFSTDEGTVWWRMLGPSGREVARSAHSESSVDAARGSIAHVVDSVDLFSPYLRQTATSRWRWVLTLDREPVVWGVGEHGRRERCEQACCRFTLLAPLADVEGEGLVGAIGGLAARH